jgi:perilipin-4
MTRHSSTVLRSVLAMAIAVAIAGCGGSPSTTLTSSAVPGGSASPSSAAGSAASSPAATAAPSEAAASSSPATQPSLPALFSNHADPDLESQLPSEVSGTALRSYSLTLTSVLDSGGDRVAIGAFLQSIGKTEADGSVAAAVDLSGALAGGIQAFKVSGAPTAALLAGIVSVEQTDLGAGATTQQATVGGKSVTVVSVGTGVNDTEWIYGRGDVVFVVSAPDETLAAAFLQALS